MKIIVSNRAKANMLSIVKHIAKDNISAAHNLREKFIYAFENLNDHPKTGRPGRVDNTRELTIHRSYIAIYRVTKGVVEILSVRHTARLWPESF